MSAIDEFLDAIRTAHVSLLPALVKMLEHQCGGAAAEVLVEAKDQGLYLDTMRFDAVGAGPQFRDLEIEELPGLPAGFALERDGASVAFGPFSWNACRVRAKVDGDRWEAAFRRWFERWLDPEDTKPVGPYGLSEVIHSASVPAHHDGVLDVQIDLGSAPLEALHELEVALRGAGAELVVFGGS